MPEPFRWREGHDDADAADDRLLAAHSNGLPDTTNPFRVQPLGELLPALKNQAIQSQQVADSQRRRAARAEARLRQLQGDLAWIALGAALLAFGAGFAIAWAIVRRGGGL